MKLGEALEIEVRTDAGMVRSHNEDAVFADADLGLAILADGMGGHNAGEVASGMATAVLANNFRNLIAAEFPEGLHAGDSGTVGAHLAREIGVANQSIYQAAQCQPQYAGMGTTLVQAWFYDNHLSVAHVGDSRLYRLRAGELLRLTRDHSFLQKQLDGGMISPEEARHARYRNLLTRALGVEPDIEVEVHDFPVATGDLYLLCSDGLSDMLDDEEIALALQTLSGNLALAADMLVQMANDAGGRDNVSVILVRARGDYSTARNWWQRVLAVLK